MATTAIPTTLAPTTVAPVDETIYVDPIDIIVRMRAYFSHFPAAIPNPQLNVRIYPEPIDITISIDGTQPNICFSVEPIEITVEISELGGVIAGEVVSDSIIDITISLESTGTITEDVRCNWIKWSKIGSLDFTMDKSVVAGERPLDWKGCVYKILKLEKTLVAYGEGGVTVLSPIEINYGMQTIYRIGIKGLNAATGNDFMHFFIDVNGKLFKYTLGKLDELDYSEYLSQMTDPVMLMDNNKGLLYICDGTYGFIYNMIEGGLGAGPVNITGIGNRLNTQYVTVPDELVIPKFSICTDTYDMGTRKPKTIHLVEIVSDVTNNLEMQIDYSINDHEGFKKTSWFYVNPDGISYSMCYGIDFRFRIKSLVDREFKIDRLKINGIVHNVSYREFLSMQTANM